MYTLGIAQSHDASICLLKDAEIKCAIALERLMRIKRAVPDAGALSEHLSAAIGWGEAVAYCLDAEGIRLEDVDALAAISPDPKTEKQRQYLVQTVLAGADVRKIFHLPHPGHHLAHALASFYTSGFDAAAALVIDCYGSVLGSERECETGMILRRCAAHEIVFQHTKPRRIAGVRGLDGLWEVPAEIQGIGEVYRVITLVLGFCQAGTFYDDAGKTMGLAPLGRPLAPKGGLLMSICNGRVDCSGTAKFLRDRNLMHKVGGRWVLATRHPTTPLSDFHRALAAQVQLEFELLSLELARSLRDTTRLEYLVLGGGSFLNSVANARIAREAGFRDVFIFPAATDDGTAVGAAFYALSQRSPDHLRRGGRQLCSASFGRSYSQTEIRRALDDCSVPYVECLDDESFLTMIAHLLRDRAIIGWLEGGAEFGPRALGNRSILANPLVPDMKDILNERVKFREAFRPFAPSVPEEVSSLYFDMNGSSPFMLRVVDVKPEYRDALRSISHVDGSARVQTVRRDANPIFHALLHKFGELTGIPILLNTSFNVNSEPIIETPVDAIRCLLSTTMDGVAMRPFFVRPVEASWIRVSRREAKVSITHSLPTGASPHPVIHARVPSRNVERTLLPHHLGILRALDAECSLVELASQTNIDVEEVHKHVKELYRLGLVTIVAVRGEHANHAYGVSDRQNAIA